MILMASYNGIIWDNIWHLCWLESISKIVGKNGDWWMIWIAWWLFDALGWIGIILDYLDGFMMIDWDLPPGKHIRKMVMFNSYAISPVVWFWPWWDCMGLRGDLQDLFMQKILIGGDDWWNFYQI